MVLPDFSKWDGHVAWNENDRKALSTLKAKSIRSRNFSISFNIFLNSQMEAVHEYARSKGVILKGDILLV